MSTPWTPNKPRSLPWGWAATVDHDVLITDGSVIVCLKGMTSPNDTKHVARVIGDEATQQVLTTGAWMRGNPERDPELTINMLRQTWRQATEDRNLDGTVLTTVDVSDWCRWVQMTNGAGDYGVYLVRFATISTGAIIALGHEYIDLFTSSKVAVSDLRFSQREGQPATTVFVTHQGRALGAFMPITNPTGDIMRGYSELVARTAAVIA